MFNYHFSNFFIFPIFIFPILIKKFFRYRLQFNKNNKITLMPSRLKTIIKIRICKNHYFNSYFNSKASEYFFYKNFHVSTQNKFSFLF